MNFNDIEGLALEYLDDPNGRRFSPETIKRLINASMDSVKRTIEDANETYFVTQTSASPGSSAPPYAHLAVVANDDTLFLDLPPDFSKLVCPENITEDPPLPLVRVQFQSRHPSMDTRFLPRGLVTPGEYFLQGNQIGIVDPSSAYSLRLTYVKTLPRYAAGAQGGSSSPEIPADWHDLISIGAAKRGYAIEQREMPPDLEAIRMEQEQSLRISMEDRDITSQRFPNVME